VNVRCRPQLRAHPMLLRMAGSRVDCRSLLLDRSGGTVAQRLPLPPPPGAIRTWSKVIRRRRQRAFWQTELCYRNAMSNWVQHCGIALGAAAVSASCSPGADQPRDITTVVEQYFEGNQIRLSSDVLQLRNGECLNFGNLTPPWKQINADELGPALAMAAPGEAVGIRPDDRSYAEFSGSDGVLRIYASGWSLPIDDDISGFVWPVAPPARIDQNIETGIFVRTDPWKEKGLGIEAFSGPGGGFAYVDARRYSQCRDYGSLGLIRCKLVSEDGYWSVGFDLSTEGRERMPSIMGQLLDVVESTRGECPR
jgi:hypothetical protein